MPDLNPPQIPFLSVGGDFERAILRKVAPEGGEDIPFKFNPTSYQLQKSNSFSEIEIPGLETPPLQFIRGGQERLTFDALFDTSDTQKNVREEYVDKVAHLMKVDAELHAPPVVEFVWQKAIFRGVVSDMTANYVLFTPKGLPMRAEVGLTLTAYRAVDEQLRDSPRNSPDVEKSVTLRRGDRLDHFASGIYQDPAKWREIARANGIRDPRKLDPGQLLLVPRLTRGRAPR